MRRTLHHSSLILITALFHGAVNAAQSRFVPLHQNGSPLSVDERQHLQEWPCVLDQTTGLLWEGKSRTPGLHHRHNTYNWFDPDPSHNGGLAGEPGDHQCREGSQTSACDTHQFIQAVNHEGLCNARDWRLPRREELRSLVDYRVPYPGPTIDTQVFPNSVAQFYWAAETSVSEPQEAWGIGFAFGFDYAYFKIDRVHARLVSDSRRAKSGATKK